MTSHGLDGLCDELADYGMAFHLESDETRVPLARALLDAAVELQVELGAKDDWDVERRGPYFGELVGRLEREVAADPTGFSH